MQIVLLASAVLFLFSFVFRLHVVFCFLVFGCQYQCNRLPGKNGLRYYLLYVSSGNLNSIHLAYSPPAHGLAVLTNSQICHG